jgi:hypothetical protein
VSSRRNFITLLGGATAFSALSASSRLVRAEGYPIQPGHLLVGFAPGGFISRQRKIAQNPRFQPFPWGHSTAR